MTIDPNEPLLRERTNEILHDHEQQLYRRTDRIFGVLLLVQWAASVAAALWLTPRTWSGAESSIHPHVWTAVGLGGALCMLPLWLVWRRPGEAITRYTIAIAQVTFSTLLIDVTGGRIETHFHVFGSMAFLAVYRDWRVLALATGVVTVDHFVSGWLWPETIFGVATASPWRSVEHAAWVVFENVFLVIAIRQSVDEMRDRSRQIAQVEANHAAFKDYSDQLSRSFQKERAIIDGALDALVEMDQRGLIIGWNQQAEQTFGWSAEEALGQTLAELIIPEQYRQAHAMGLRKYCETGHGPALRQRLELEALHRDGHSFPIEFAITPVDQGDEKTFCAFVRDITERTRHEQELRRAIEQAEAASRIKSEFLANMSHEIRTPLNGILGFTELLIRDADKGDERERRDFVETIRASGQHLLALINDVLDLSKIEAGQMQVECARFSPHQIIAEVASVLRVRANEKGILLDYRWDGAIPETIESDPYRLRQLLMNLVGNAVKFTEQGSVMIVASVANQQDVSQLTLEVRDTGIGISAEQLDGVFKPFVQADSSVTRKFGGTGLGLSISKNIAEALGGTLTVRSEPGRGSTFRFTIPAGDFRGVTMLDVPNTVRTGDYVDTRDSHADLEGVRVLLADDGETNRKLIHLFLTRHGAEVFSVENGDLACRVAASQQFDVVLMDMQMPVLDGYAATRALRSQGFTGPIIALTAHAMAGDREKCEQAGCSAYLSKPVNVDKLVQLVHATTGGAKRPRRPASRTIAPASQPLPRDDDAAIYSNLPTDDDEIREIVSEFAATIPARIDEIERSLAELDFEALATLAHGLKGVGGTAGFPVLAKLSADLEDVVTRRQSDEAAMVIGQLRSVQARIVV